MYFNWLKEKMGFTNSEYLSDLSDDSSVTDSDSYYSDEGDETMPIVPHLTTDAAKRVASLPNAKDVICVDSVREIEEMLDEDEIVSLVFLLYDEVHFTLQKFYILFEGGESHLIYEWAVQQETKHANWQQKLVEALCIIKNYQVLKRYGFNKTDVICHYLPHLPKNSLHINKVRKALYLICEKLTPEKTDELIKYVRNNFKHHQMKLTNNQQYLEFYLLQWEAEKYISQTDLANLKQALKIIHEEHLCDLLDGFSSESSPKMQDAVQNNGTLRNDKPSTSYEYTEMNSNNIDNHRYKINPDNPGVVLIINEQDFYTEFRPEFKNLLPPETIGKLDTRIGTRQDKKHLENVFSKFGFKVIMEDNLTHLDMISKIEEVVSGITDESSLFICILSHGDKGVVYGSNSCRVKVSFIQKLMSKSNLLGKPKVLILQSCQGRQCQILCETSSDDEEQGMSLTTDGPSGSRPVLPRTTDFLVFWATVPGYAAIRNTKTGSWFIQALCRKMEEYKDRYHFADICTRTCRDVANRVWDSEEERKAMTPMVVSTLTYDFYLPPLRSTE